MKADITFKTGKGPSAMIAKLRALSAALSERLPEAMRDAVWKVASAAARIVNVDTGRLRASIAGAVTSSSAKVRGFVGSNVDYAGYQEAMKPYLAPAIEQNREWIVQRFEAEIDKVVSSVS